MPKLRTSFLELIRTLGNHSGCHQMPERSFFYKGKQFPVCARCTGVGIGQAAAVLSAVCGCMVSVFASFVLLAIMGFDWLIQETEIHSSTNLRRLITGICGGFGLFSLYFHAGKALLRFIIKSTAGRTRAAKRGDTSGR